MRRSRPCRRVSTRSLPPPARRTSSSNGSRRSKPARWSGPGARSCAVSPTSSAGGVDGLGTRLDEGATADREQLEELRRNVAGLADRQEQTADAEHGHAEIRRVGDAGCRSSQPPVPTVDSLAQRLAAVEAAGAATPWRSELSALAARLDDFGADLARVRAATSVAALRGELDGLRQAAEQRRERSGSRLTESEHARSTTSHAQQRSSRPRRRRGPPRSTAPSSSASSRWSARSAPPHGRRPRGRAAHAESASCRRSRGARVARGRAASAHRRCRARSCAAISARSAHESTP